MPAKPRPLLDLRDLPAALGLLTRLPVKVNTDHAMARGAAAAWAFPIVGIIVAVCVVTAGALAMAVGLPAPITAGLALAIQTLVTGAMHEDGLADCADGFWGGWTKQRRLAIMKDSRIGAYGVLALIFGIGLKWAAWTALLSHGAEAWAWIFCAAMVSRATMVWSMATLPHARPGGLAAQVGRPSLTTAGIAVGLAGAITAFATGGLGLLALALAWVLASLLGRLARYRIGGQTGDVLGGIQFTTETACLIAATVLV